MPEKGNTMDEKTIQLDFDTSELDGFTILQFPPLVKVEKRMLEFKDGARAQVIVTWKEGTEKYVRNGKVIELPRSHTFVAENNNGIIRFVDPQNGKEDCSDYFTNVKNGCTMFVRIDNLPVNEDIIDLFIMNRGG
jgi:hypothetical protein